MTLRDLPFDYFVVIASMRTGSNLLEERLRAHSEIETLGELFNPHFLGRPGKEEALGVNRASRNKSPMRLVDAVISRKDKLAGFRLFDDHDGRVLDHILHDPKCARILLTRNPLDSYLSLKIARQTNQWWLGDSGSHKSVKAEFDAEEFAEYLRNLTEFRTYVRRTLQVSGLTAYHLRYEDLTDIDVIDGLFRYLGLTAPDPKKSVQAKVQNPGYPDEKVANPDLMRNTLACLDPFDLDRIPDFEPERGGGASGAILAEKAGLLVVPTCSVTMRRLGPWLDAANDGAETTTGLTQKSLKTWMRHSPSHRAIGVVGHPILRAFDVFRRRVLGRVNRRDRRLVSMLETNFALDPRVARPDAHTEEIGVAFRVFLTFIRKSLNGQTGHRIERDWASQTAVLAGFSTVRALDHLVRGDVSQELLDVIAPGHSHRVPNALDDAERELAMIYDDSLEQQCRSAYRRDYAFLGFETWRAPTRS